MSGINVGYGTCLVVSGIDGGCGGCYVISGADIEIPCKLKHKKPHSSYNLYRKRGFLYLVLECGAGATAANIRY
eukprot:1342721-Rhodomonas_salina.3